nr:PREDICTED: pro-resilin-like [Megachile rotundata]
MYLPPTGNVPRPTTGDGLQDEWVSDPANYEFSCEIENAIVELNFGHHESRKNYKATGSYHVLLPDSKILIVDYIAVGYRPMVQKNSKV